MWTLAIRREKWMPTKNSRLFSAHFKGTDYIQKPGSSVKLLKPDAIPTIFNFPKHLQKCTSARRIIVRTDESHETSEVSVTNLIL